jgi:ribosomal protein S18 acetylase RimI-like enzyme
MCDEWMPGIKLSLTHEQFRQLPRNSAYKYEYLQDTAYLTPRPKFFHAVLDLAPPAPKEQAPEDIRLRPFSPEDWPELEAVFAAAFDRLQPFGSLDDATRQRAAHESLRKTRTGGDGPLIEPASFVAVDVPTGRLAGAILITLLPEGDPADWESYYWREPAPADAVARRAGRAHLTWVLVSPWHSGAGVGSALLAAAAEALRATGFAHLFTTFLLGNDTSLLWHWRNGFRLLPYPGSRRRLRTADTDAP